MIVSASSGDVLWRELCRKAISILGSSLGRTQQQLRCQERCSSAERSQV